MKIGFYLNLALNGIKKNMKLYLPYILTCVLMIAITYILLFLDSSRVYEDLPGWPTLRALLGLGFYVVSFFSLIFLFYTNSFLIKQRKREFGLYNILGMNKANIAKILALEAIILAAVSLVLGLALGMLLSKLAELGLLYLLGAEVNYDLAVSWESILLASGVFLGIFALIFLNSLFQISVANPIELLKSGNVGEKPPKGNWFIGLVGVALLIGAYTISVSLKEPLVALSAFFVAVLMVIAGTYMVMVSGSVYFIRKLKSSKKFYYNPKHFVSVSSMAYRMKRNGAGLASICILATMVLVIVSTTTCLYFGLNDAVENRCPRDVNTSFVFGQSFTGEEALQCEAQVQGIIQSHGLTAENVESVKGLLFYGALHGEDVKTIFTDMTESEEQAMLENLQMYQFCLIPTSEYNAVSGADVTLANDEALVYFNRNSLDLNALNFSGGATLRVKERLDDFIKLGVLEMTITPSVVVVVNNPDEALGSFRSFTYPNGESPINPMLFYSFDVSPPISREQEIDLGNEIEEFFEPIVETEGSGLYGVTVEMQEVERRDFLSIYGGINYLGIILSLVFGSAAILIIYYKQISEGYEDQSRFEIMRKVGMTKEDIRRSINSQLWIIFFLPLILAVVHLAFAFPIIARILLMLQLRNTSLFIVTTLVSIIAYSFLYAVVYRVTSNEYFNIVSK